MAEESADLEGLIYKYAIKNAFLHSGKADVGAVVGKVIALQKEAEVDLKKIVPKIQGIVKGINSMPFAEIEEEYKKFEEAGYELKPKEKKIGLPDLEWMQSGKESVVARFAPNPNGPMHFGHARACYMSYAFAEKYAGKFILRFDDTDPKIKKPVAEAYKAFERDVEWLNGSAPNEIIYASDRLDLYYDYMRRLIEKDGAYICNCASEKWRGLIRKGKGCKCRAENKKEQMKKFKKMLAHESREGEAVIRIKTDLAHKDPSTRDWWIAKIVDKPEHPRVSGKYLWPSYNFASAIDDHELGITLIIRGQQHAQNETKQKFLYEYFKWKYPHAITYGLLKLSETVLSKSKIKAKIEEGEFSGFDDPRVGTLENLRRRGITAEAIREILIDIGVKPNDITVSEDALYDANRNVIDANADRIIFISEPVLIDVQFAQGIDAKLPRHPDASERGEKVYHLNEGMQRFIIEKGDAEKLKTGETIRLKHAYNVRIVKKDSMQIFAEFVSASKIDAPLIPWLLEEESIGIEVLMPDAKIVYGSAEAELLKYDVGSILQLERLGYARLDAREGNSARLWFAHK
ncbi:MAG: glutamate--tRNA ligase [Candidatus Diapherotrites archaeon]|nr:glutamate--tRNA ligase [Candidatus Diapherotrites archaeon]